MKQQESQAESCWDEALSTAVSDGADESAQRTSLFLEEREDAAVVIDCRDARPETHRSRLRGLAARAETPGGGTAFLGNPGIEDARALVRATSGERLKVPQSARTSGESMIGAPLPITAATGLLARLVEQTRRLQPTATLRARWVGFRQVIRVARAGRPLVRDVRQGGRIRLEILAGGEDPAQAVVELAVSPDLAKVKLLLERIPGELATRLDERRRTRTMPSGERVVVFAPAVGGVLIHEIVGHALEADVVLRGSSWLREVDGAVGPADLTVVDDPRRGRAGWKVDDEGETARPIALLRAGRVAGWLHDRASSRESGRPTTGHGRRASFRDPVKPRMGCTWVAAGRHHPAEALEGVHDGIYVRRLEAASTDPRTGRSVFRVSDADRIHRGRLDAALAAHVISVDGARALKGIENVASDLEFDRCIGSCLRGGQPLSTSVGAPTFRIGMIRATF